MKVVIVGGVAGGATAAARLRRLDENAKIVILERSGFVSYANCGLPYYIGGVIQDKEALTLQTPETFYRRLMIDVRTHHEVLSIHPDRKCVLVRKLDDGSVYEESYDKLILSPGAKAVLPPTSGLDCGAVFTLRTVEDTYRIHDFIEAHRPKDALVVGGGFIGLEMAENLIHRGIRTTLLQRGEQVMPPLDYDMACGVHAYLRQKGLDLRLKNSAAAIEKQPDGRLKVTLTDGQTLCTDFVIMAIGVVPETHLAKDAGLALGAKESILVDSHMKTSHPDIYAVGDAIQIKNAVTGGDALIPLAGPANKQARIAADNICGIPSAFHGTQGSAVMKLFDMTVATTGVNEKTAKAAGLTYDKTISFSASHATYYPGATDMTIKTLFNPENGQILGAEIVGFDGVDKRIDDLAIAVRHKFTAADLTELELSYAPPYSSAKDPVNMVGFIIENLQNGLVRQCHWHEYMNLPRDGSVTFLDVRFPADAAAHPLVPNAVAIPLESLRGHLNELDPAKPIYVNCYSGLRSYLACRLLTQRGFTCYNLSGGSRFYQQVMDDLSFDETPRHSCGLPL